MFSTIPKKFLQEIQKDSQKHFQNPRIIQFTFRLMQQEEIVYNKDTLKAYFYQPQKLFQNYDFEKVILSIVNLQVYSFI